MSLFVSFPYEDRIELLTDGACYSKRGKLITVQEKVWRSSDCPMIVTGRGNSRMVRDLAKMFLAAAVNGSFRDAIHKIETHFDQWRSDHGIYSGKFFQMLIAGHDEELGGFAQFHVASHANWLPGMSGMQVNTVWGVFYAGPDLGTRPEAAAAAAEILTEDTVRAGAATFGPDFCQIIRETPMVNADNPEIGAIPSVGGHIDLTTLDKHGSHTERLLTWPDRRLKMMDITLEPTILIRGAPKRNTAIVTAPPPFITPERIAPMPAMELAA